MGEREKGKGKSSREVQGINDEKTEDKRSDSRKKCEAVGARFLKDSAKWCKQRTSDLTLNSLRILRLLLF